MIKEFFKCILIGLLGLLLFNIIGQFFGLNVPINIFTVLTLGFLRLPGLIILLILLLL